MKFYQCPSIDPKSGERCNRGRDEIEWHMRGGHSATVWSQPAFWFDPDDEDMLTL